MNIRIPENRPSVFRAVAFLATCLCCGSTLADIGPNVRLRLEPTVDEAAVAGQTYSGRIIVEAGRPVTVTGVSVVGEGWSVRPIAFAPTSLVAGQFASYSFEATPTDPDAPLRVQAQLDQHTLNRSFKVGPAAYQIRDHGRPLVRLGPSSPTGGRTPQAAPTGPSSRGGLLYHFQGRLVITRTDGQIVGADNITYRVMDDDLVGSETIVEALTDENGNFDVSVFWDDGSDDPDLYVEFECDTPVVVVQDSSILEVDYTWNTQDNVVEDFLGAEFDFGTLTPADSAEFPAVHIHNTITRAHRYVDEHSVDLPQVDVQWPEDGDVSYYNTFFEEIHIAGTASWEESTAAHEYGHHFMENEASNPSTFGSVESTREASSVRARSASAAARTSASLPVTSASII